MLRTFRDEYERLLPLVEKPGRYLGNERGAIRKDLERVAVRVALAFPEVYEIAQSHLGLQILYDVLNRREDVAAERAYAPWGDLERLLRARGTQAKHSFEPNPAATAARAALNGGVPAGSSDPKINAALSYLCSLQAQTY